MKRALWITLIPISLISISFLTWSREKELSTPGETRGFQMTHNKKDVSSTLTMRRKKYTKESNFDKEANDQEKGEVLTQYYDNTKKKSVEVILNDLLNGPCEYFNDQGILVAQGTMLNNRKEGLWKYYSDDGVHIKTITYRSGDEIASLLN